MKPPAVFEGEPRKEAGDPEQRHPAEHAFRHPVWSPLQGPQDVAGAVRHAARSDIYIHPGPRFPDMWYKINLCISEEPFIDIRLGCVVVVQTKKYAYPRNL